MAVNEADETFKRLVALPGVEGIIIMNGEGIPIRTTYTQGKTAHFVSLLHGFLNKTRSAVKEMDHLNELTFIRLRSHQNEILIAPDKEFSMVVVQKPEIS